MNCNIRILNRKLSRIKKGAELKTFEDYRRDPRYYYWRIKSNVRSALRRITPITPRVRHLPNPKTTTPHWVVCFYGVDRSLKYTIWGILNNLIAPIVESGANITLVCHFNLLDNLKHIGSKGEISNLSSDNIQLLNPDICLLEKQNYEDIKYHFDSSASIPWKIDTDVFKNATVNLLFQLHSLNRLFELLELTNLDNEPIYLLARSDLQYLEKIPAGDLYNEISSDHSELITPTWQKWGGLNDRFAILNNRAMNCIAGRKKYVEEFVRKFGYLHAEELLLYAAQKNDLRLGYTTLRSERVRSSGKTLFEPFDPH